jgi:hypothetical protein
MADYRNLAAGFQEISKPVTPDVVSYAEDGVAVVEHVRSLPGTPVGPGIYSQAGRAPTEDKLVAPPFRSP